MGTATTRKASARSRWLEAAVRVPVDVADALGTLLVEAGSEGVITGVQELARGPRRRTHETVRGFFPSREPVRARLAVRAALNRLRGPGSRARVRWRELDAKLWEMDWREHFQPVRAGASLVVVPPWNRDAWTGRHRIVVHPGMAFGTGQHATTRSCLEALERLVPLPSSALDVGTGTGVLAIALAKLGVRRVLALDTDPQATAAARGNVRRNAAGGRIRIETRTLEDAMRRHGARPTRARRPGRTTAAATRAARTAPLRFPLVVANLYVDVLVALAPVLRRVVTPGGHLVTSGVLRTQQARLRAAFAAPAWRVVQARRVGSWTTTVFRRTERD